MEINCIWNMSKTSAEVVHMAIKSLSIRIDEEVLDKLHIVADYEGWSANSEILILIRDAIEEYEEKHGKIIIKN